MTKSSTLKGMSISLSPRRRESQEEEAEGLRARVLSDKVPHQQYSIVVAEGLIRLHSSLKSYKQLMIAGRGRGAFLSGIALVTVLPELNNPVTAQASKTN